MFNEKDILARLQAGESIEDIAKEMTAILNSADSAHQKYLAEQEAKAKEAKKLARKQELVDCMKRDIQDYIALEAPELVQHIDGNETSDQIMQGLDTMIASLKTLIPLLDSASNVKTNISTNNKNNTLKSDEAVLNDFLKKLGF